MNRFVQMLDDYLLSFEQKYYAHRPTELVCFVTREDQLRFKEEIIALAGVALSTVSYDFMPKEEAIANNVFSIVIFGITIHFIIGPITCIGEMTRLK